MSGVETKGMLNEPGHVVAALFQLDEGFAVVASLPTLVLGHLHDAICLWILWTLPFRVELAIASYADLSAAATTLCVLPAIREVHTDLRWLDPFPAASMRTVDTVRSSVLLIFSVPCPLEVVVEESLYIAKRDMVMSAASWRHVLRIFDGEEKLALEASVAHPVATAKEGGFVDWPVVPHADKTLNPSRG